TALMLAPNQNLEVVSALLKAGADVRAKDNHGGNALYWASRMSLDPAIISVLISAGSDVQARSDLLDDTPLIAAAMGNKNPDIIGALINGGSDVGERVGSSNDTALLVAAGNNPNPA